MILNPEGDAGSTTEGAAGMGWSTSEIASLAGTTVNTVRHYHRLGLLEQPERLSNGYKTYEVAHLVQLLRVRRLRELGVPLDRIDAVATGDETARATLVAIDDDLKATIERLQQARSEIRSIVDGAAPPDVPRGFEKLAGRITATDRALVLIYSQLYDDEAMNDIREMLENDSEEVRLAFDALTPDADERTRSRLAADYAVELARDYRAYPWLLDPLAHHARRPEVTWETLAEAVGALYNSAQLDVIARAHAIALELLETTAP